MLIDLRQWDGGAAVSGDVCVLGAGAAGITMARRLAASGLQVWVVEGGGLDPDVTVQSLYDGESVGQQLASPSYCRLRYFGGTTNHWQGWCAPLQGTDFSARSWVPWSGWPIAASDLADYYRQAARICQLGDAHAVAARAPEPLGRFEPRRLEPMFWRYSPPTRFGQAYRSDLRSSESVHVLLHGNVRRIETTPSGGAVRAVHVSTLSGKSLRMSARVFVLACGGLENPRLLLLTNDVESAGLGNRSGLVGRFFTQHIEVSGGQVLAHDAERLVDALDRRRFGGADARYHLRPGAAEQERRRMLNCGVGVGATRTFSEGYQAAQDLWHDVERGSWPDHLAHDVWTMARDVDGLTADLFRPERTLREVTLNLYCEQAPNPYSLVRLADTRDALGMPRVHVDWRLSDLDRHSLRQAVQCFAEELGRLGMGRIRMADWLRQDDGAWPERIWSGCHHMGTTRMSDDPQRGVVDRHCRLHSVSNLYVAGSSVFPTGGYVPPTFTIVALALRLSDRIRQELSSGRL